MPTPHIGTLLITAIAACVSRTPAQQVFQVSVGQSVQAVIDAASPGDIIELAPPPGAYEKFVLDRGLTIRGPATIGGFFAGGPGDLVVDVPVGQRARFADLTIVPTTSPFGAAVTIPSSVRVLGGSVVFEDCEVGSSIVNVAPALWITDATVVLDRCVVTGNGVSALGSLDSVVAAVDCVLEGNLGLFGPQSATVAAAGSGSLQLSHCDVSGGSSTRFSGANPASPAVGSTVPTFVTDSVLVGGTGGDASSPSAGSPAIFATQAFWARTSFVAGGGTPAATTAIVGNVTNAPGMLGVTSSSGPRLGQPLALDYSTEAPASFVALFATTSGIVPVALPGIAQPVWSGDLFYVSGTLSDPSAIATFTIAVPSNPVFVNRAFDLFGFTATGGTIEAAPPVAGLVR